MAGLPAIIQAVTASVIVIIALGGVVHRFVIRPIKDTAEEANAKGDEAMTRANTAISRAEAAEQTADRVGDRVDDKLDNIGSSLTEIQQTLDAQAREARGRTYTIHRLVEAIRESDDIDAENVPDVNQDDFLRGGESNRYESGDDD